MTKILFYLFAFLFTGFSIWITGGAAKYETPKEEKHNQAVNYIMNNCGEQTDSDYNKAITHIVDSLDLDSTEHNVLDDLFYNK